MDLRAVITICIGLLTPGMCHPLAAPDPDLLGQHSNHGHHHHPPSGDFNSPNAHFQLPDPYKEIENIDLEGLSQPTNVHPVGDSHQENEQNNNIPAEPADQEGHIIDQFSPDEDHVSIPVEQHQSEENHINQNQFEGINANLDGNYTNQRLDEENNVNQYQSEINNVNQFQSQIINANQYQPEQNNANHFQSNINNVNQYQPEENNINQYQPEQNYTTQYEENNTSEEHHEESYDNQVQHEETSAPVYYNPVVQNTEEEEDTPYWQRNDQSQSGSYLISNTFPDIKILKDERYNNEGTYSVDFETENGIQMQLAGQPDPKTGAVNSEGTYSYPLPNGELFTMKFVANENGFQPESPFLPVAPAYPHDIPDFVIEQIERAKKEDALKNEQDHQENPQDYEQDHEQQ